MQNLLLLAALDIALLGGIWGAVRWYRKGIMDRYAICRIAVFLLQWSALGDFTVICRIAPKSNPWVITLILASIAGWFFVLLEHDNLRPPIWGDQQESHL